MRTNNSRSTGAMTGAIVMAIAIPIVLAGCGNKSDSDFVASATASLQKGDTKAAVIDLKSALQKNAQSGEARFLLGKTLLDSGDANGAVVELQKAAELKYNIAKVLPALARLRSREGAGKALAEALAAVPNFGPALILKARFAADKKEHAAAQALLDALLTREPKNADAWML